MTVTTGAPTARRTRVGEHQRLLDEVTGLILPAQTPGSVDTQRLSAIVEHAEGRGWWDVAMVADYVFVLASRYDPTIDGPAHLHRVLDRARSTGDVVWEALALAMGATHAVEDPRPRLAADRDLARATVLLRDADRSHGMLPSAHGQCATGYLDREMWELAIEHTSVAAGLLDDDRDAWRKSTALYNRAEIELRRLCVMRQSGPAPELEELGAAARAAIRAVPDGLLPDSWYVDLHIFENLVDAIAPPPGGAPRPSADADGAEFATYLDLAAGFTDPDPARARGHLARVMGAWDRVGQPELHLLTLTRDAELEAIETGHETAGLRLGRELSLRRHEARVAAAEAMTSLIEKEQLVTEHARLRDVAELDALTGVANRRGLAAHVESLSGGDQGGGPRLVTLVLVDVDHFKRVNDDRGHEIGDAVLVRVAAALRRIVRVSDLVARWGGDEFILLLDTDNLDAARDRCEEAVRLVRADDWDGLAEGLDVTVSIGLATGEVRHLDALREAADRALYRAKLRGRDGVSV